MQIKYRNIRGTLMTMLLEIRRNGWCRHENSIIRLLPRSKFIDYWNLFERCLPSRQIRLKTLFRLIDFICYYRLDTIWQYVAEFLVTTMTDFARCP